MMVVSLAAKLSSLIVQSARRARFRLMGVELGTGCKIGRHVKVSGEVVLGDGVILQDDCVISGNVMLGKQVTVQKLTELAGNIEIADGTTVGAYSYISTMPAGRIRIGQKVLVNAYSIIGAGESVTIGNDCIFAAYVQITDSTHRFGARTDSPRYDPATSKPVTIGAGTWLGSSVKVLQGVHIGEGCVVGAGAVVVHSLPDYAVAVGIPARVVRLRG